MSDRLSALDQKALAAMFLRVLADRLPGRFGSHDFQNVRGIMKVMGDQLGNGLELCRALDEYGKEVRVYLACMREALKRRFNGLSAACMHKLAMLAVVVNRPFLGQDICLVLADQF